MCPANTRLWVRFPPTLKMFRGDLHFSENVFWIFKVGFNNLLINAILLLARKVKIYEDRELRWKNIFRRENFRKILFFFHLLGNRQRVGRNQRTELFWDWKKLPIAANSTLAKIINKKNEKLNFFRFAGRRDDAPGEYWMGSIEEHVLYAVQRIQVIV
jgi:hypothetical protein